MMVDYLLHEGAGVFCLHKGEAKPKSADSRVTVSGQKIVTMPNPHIITGCKLSTTSGGPCVIAVWIRAAKRVTASRMPVLLKDSQAICSPTQGGVKIDSTQTRVKGT